MGSRSVLAVLALAAALVTSGIAQGRESEQITLGDGLSMPVPKNWERQEPRVRIIEHEFTVPSEKEGVDNGRVTVMQAGGTVEDNIERWLGQFIQKGGKKTADVAKVEKKEVAGRTVHLVDVSGTFKDSRGPFAPVVERPGYRMLAAIVPTKQGNYFIKLTGPEAVVVKEVEAFRGMVVGMKK